MAICKKLSYIFVTFFFINYSSALADFSKLSDVKITTMDFLLSKFDNFFIKNKHKILGYNPFSIRYQSINYYVIYKKDEHIEVFLEAVMDRKRYREKKYYPKLVDCNVIRNRIFYDKFGYTVFRRKKNNSLNEDLMNDILKTSIYNLENLNDELRDFLISKTKINVEIIHPTKSRNRKCSGNLLDIELN